MSYISEKKEKFRKDAEISRQKELAKVSAERQRLEQVKREKDAISENKERIREIRTEKIRNALKGFQQFTKENQKRAKFRQSSSANNPFSPPGRSNLTLNNNPPGNRLINQDPRGNRAINTGPGGGVFGSSPMRKSNDMSKPKKKQIIINL